MKNLKAINSDDLLNSAQQLEARSDPTFVAQELRALVASAKPAVEKDLFDLVFRMAINYASCRCGTRAKNAGTCGYCQAITAVEKARKAP